MQKNLIFNLHPGKVQVPDSSDFIFSAKVNATLIFSDFMGINMAIYAMYKSIG